MAELERAYAGGQAELNTLLDEYRRLVQMRREFLDSVQNYGHGIAAYALAVASPGLSPDRLVGMLITTAPADHSVLATRRSSSSGIQRVSGQDELPPPRRSIFPGQ